MKKFLVLLLFVIVGCGYATRGFIYADDKIIIRPVINKIDITAVNRDYSDYVSFPILIENRLTNELVNKFNIEGNLRVVSQSLEALELTCVVKGYDKETLRYTDSDTVNEQRLRLRVRIKLTSSKGEILKEKDVVGESTYYLDQKSESAAQQDLIDDTARRICEAVTEEW